MVVSNVPKQGKQKIAVVPQASLSATAKMPDILPSQETTRIRERAYELYEVGGRKPGHDEQDWLQAEQEILKQRL
ncbi:MAG TPA: DUF2934 domain-containing protein [Candidatus Sulfotelmatobacter sp.]|nr:DUF2934 domain-containing protein [Candidatus Sulfotelmatobacter sp.]